MQVFKFGGASIRHASAIRNMADIIRNYGEKPLIIVVSAMGKTTRHLEAYIDDVVEGKLQNSGVHEIGDYHFNIMHELFQENDPVFDAVKEFLAEMEQISFTGQQYSRFYDQVVSVG